jgi:prepilin-type N-terminal cleavage/methylation domain-containing protein
MKTRLKSRRNDGFTLVELLVVIAIIAVLAGAGFAAGNAAIQKAKKTTALSTCTSMELAVNNFFSDYGAMPKDNLSSDTKTDTNSDLELLRVLLGKETGTSTLNSKAVKYLSVKEGRANKNGLMYNTSGSDVTGLFDPWGGPYSVMLDGDYDEKISVTPAGSTSKTLNGRRVAVWSNGADAAPTGSGGKSGDNVTTW